MASPKFDLAGFSGRGGSGRSRRGGRSGRRRPSSASLAKKLAQSRSSGISDDRLAALGEGGKQASRLLAEIEDSNVPESVKRQARARYEGGGSNRSGGILGAITGGLGNAVEGALSAVDKPKRAVLASIEELAEEAGLLDEDSDTWADNVLRKRTYGGGDLVQKSIDSGNEQWLDSKWKKRAAGLILDIGYDPLTYVTAGMSRAAGAAGTGAGAAARGGGRVAGREGARALEKAGVREAAEAVLRANTGLAATSDELAEAGLRGGVRLAGQTIIPHDVARALGGKAVASAKTKAAGTKSAEALRKVFGGSGDLRTAMRAGDDPLRALHQFDSARAARLGAARFTAQQSSELVEVARSLKKSGIDGEELSDALRQGPGSRLFRELDAQSDGAASRAAAWQASVRAQANEIAGFDYIAERQNFVHRLLTPEAREHFAKVANGQARARPFAKSDFERQALKAGDEWMGVRLTDDAPIETQIQSIANDVFGTDAKKLFEDDWFEIAPAYLRSVQKSVRDKGELQALRERGVITDTPVTGLDELAVAVREMKVAEPEAFATQAANFRRFGEATHDPNQAAVWRALADRADLDAEMARQSAARTQRAQGAVDVLERELTNGGLRKPETQAAIREMIDQQLAQQFELFKFNPMTTATTQKLGGMLGEQIDADLLEEMVKARQLVDSDYNKFLRAVDAANRGFKTYALLTPGFHVRNTFGGTFNNAVAGVDPSSYLTFARMHRAHNKVLAGKLKPSQIKNQHAYAKYKELFESGLLDDGARVVDATDMHSPRHIKDVFRGAPGRPTIREFKAAPREAAKDFAKSRPLTDTRFTRLNRLAGQQTEDYLRGTLALDRLLKGSTIDGAIDDVHHFHFDYHDLSKFEEGFAKRVIPFYTWTSRNLGRQLEFFLTNPKAYSRWNATKAALGDPEEGPSATPDYLQGPGTIRWAGGDALRLPDSVPVIGGEHLIKENMTLTPGMPFEAADESLRRLNNPAAFLLQDASPFLKVPIETTFDTQFYSGIPLSRKSTPVPEKWKQIPGFMRVLERLDMARRSKGPDGEWLISGEHAYVLEQNLPLLGRVRRMFPSEEKYQDRATTAWLSFIGLGSRTVDPSTQEAEMYRRADDLRQIRDRRREEGYEIGDPQRKPR